MKEESIEKRFLVDASSWLAWLLPDEKVPETLISYFELFKDNKVHFMAPALLKYEFANALKSNYLRKRLGKIKAGKLIRKLLELNT